MQSHVPKKLLDIKISDQQSNQLNIQKNTLLSQDARLLDSAKKGDIGKLRTALNHQADVNVKDKYGWTPLMLAAFSGNFSCLDELISHGAKVNDFNPTNGRTALHCAAYCGHLKCTRKLVQHGAVLDVVDNDGDTPLACSVVKGEVGCVQFLLQKGVNINIKNNKNLTAKDIASNNGHILVVQHIYQESQRREETRERIHRLAEKGSSEAQYILGTQYYMPENNMQQAIYWCMQAAEHKHVRAFHYLKKTSFSSEIYVMIAEGYEQGKQVEKNIALAVEFYMKAIDAGSKSASFHLAQLYEAGGEDLLSDANKAYYYYLIAFKKGHELALKSLEALVKTQKNSAWQYEVGMLHEKVLENNMSALPWYKKAADAGHREAINRLEQLSNNADFAYKIAQTYDQGEERAYEYYAKAALKGHKEAFQYLENLALIGNKFAQYALGYHYYQSIGNLDKAVDWCLLAADQNYEPAKKYLSQTNFNASECLLIARKLEGDKDNKQTIVNKVYALQYYETACSLSNIEAALYLGYFYQNNHEDIGILQDNDKACGYLIKAALQGSSDALVSIECLGNDVSPSIQYKISEMYGCHPVKNTFKQASWAKIAEQSTQDAEETQNTHNESLFSTTSNFFSGFTENNFSRSNEGFNFITSNRRR